MEWWARENTWTQHRILTWTRRGTGRGECPGLSGVKGKSRPVVRLQIPNPGQCPTTILTGCSAHLHHIDNKEVRTKSLQEAPARASRLPKAKGLMARAQGAAHPQSAWVAWRPL